MKTLSFYTFVFCLHVSLHRKSKNMGKVKTFTSLKEKASILEDLQTSSRREVAEKYNVSLSTLCRLSKKREDIDQSLTKKNSKIKRCSRLKFEKVDTALLEWFRVQRNRNLPISGPILLEKAKEFAEKLGIQDFKGSIGWLDKWKRRHDVVFRVVSGEAAAVNTSAISTWFEDQWKPVCDQYKPEDIYNADETGVFWRMLPDRTLSFSGEKCSGGKNSKERLTVLLCANLTGTDKLTPFVIGKSAKPRAFRGVKTLPVEYAANKKAWMTSATFVNWLNTFDRRMKREKRSILLLLDNCPAHPHHVKLSNIKLLFLPPNTTSVSQPLDQGIIQSFKSHYRRRMLQTVIQKMDASQPNKIDILEGIRFISLAWNLVTSTTILNCFKKAGFEVPEEDDEISVEHEVLSSVDIPLDLYASSAGVSAQEVCSVEEYIHFDDHVVTSADLNEQDILDNLSQEEEIGEEPDADVTEENETQTAPVSSKDALAATQTLMKFLVQESFDDKHIHELSKIEDLCFSSRFRNARQSTLDSFLFKRPN